jgi:hypothetical protein
MPFPEGVRYHDRVPDTLDLAEMAALAINGLTGPYDPAAGYELYFMVYLQRNPPVMQHDFSDDNQMKFMAPLALMRVVTGSRRAQDFERGMIEARLKCLTPDGLYHRPFSGRPWLEENMWPEVKPKQRTQPLPPYEGGRMSPRLLEALIVYARLSSSPLFKELADNMVTNGAGGGLEAYVKTTDEWGVAPGTQESSLPKGFLACDAWTPQALSQYYRWTGNELVKTAVGRLVNYQKDHINFFDPSGKFILTTPGVAPAHFHLHSLSILGFLEYALAAHDARLAEYCRKSYEWARSQGSVTTGFFPENIVPDFPNSEGCPVADMIALALTLSKAGVGDYWDDADRWLRNFFAELQLRRDKADKLAQATRNLPAQSVHYSETADRVLERNIGAFAGWPGPNEWMHRIGIQHCCTGNCARTLYYAWESILEWQHEDLRINLLLNRASPWADVHSFVPYEGQVELRIKQPCRSVQVRLPEWVPAGCPEVVCKFGKRSRAIHWQGRFVSVGAAKSGDQIRLSFPMVERTVRERMGGTDYTLSLKGNTVVAIDPPGKICPLYERAQYHQHQAPMLERERFVASHPLDF